MAADEDCVLIAQSLTPLVQQAYVANRITYETTFCHQNFLKDANIFVDGTVLHEEDLMADLLLRKIPGGRSIRKSEILSFSDRDNLWDD